MTTNKDSHQKSNTKLSNQNPLADIAGKFGGEFWCLTQSEIERSRSLDREETERLLNTSSDRVRQSLASPGDDRQGTSDQEN
jgi:hypothetical protein